MNSKKILVALLLACLLAGLGFWYWTRTPQYSMMKLTEAVHNHDGLSFRNYCDVNSVASNAVSDLSAEELRELGGPKLLRRIVGLTIIGIFKPQMTEMLSKNIIDYVEKNQTLAITEVPLEGEAKKESKEG